MQFLGGFHRMQQTDRNGHPATRAGAVRERHDRHMLLFLQANELIPQIRRELLEIGVNRLAKLGESAIHIRGALLRKRLGKFLQLNQLIDHFLHNASCFPGLRASAPDSSDTHNGSCLACGNRTMQS